MEAIILSSRAISHNHCFQKQKQEQYRKHMEAVKLITQEKHLDLEEMAHDVEHAAQLLKKSKSAAKIFQQRHQKQQLRNENMSLIKKLWTLPPKVETKNGDEKYQFVCGSHRTLQMRRQAEIHEENHRIIRKAIIQRLEKRDFKEKMREEIKDYLELRDKTRRFKKKSSLQRSQSEMKRSSYNNAQSAKKLISRGNPEALPQSKTARILPFLTPKDNLAPS